MTWTFGRKGPASKARVSPHGVQVTRYSAVMEIEGVFGQIGELGPAQTRLFLLLSLPGPWIAFHTFITNFIGGDPGWTCSVHISESHRDDFTLAHQLLPLCSTTVFSSDNCSSTEGGGGASSRDCSDTSGLPVLVTDPEEKCRHYENGDCLPQFETSEYTSIVSEVSAKFSPAVCLLFEGLVSQSQW